MVRFILETFTNATDIVKMKYSLVTLLLILVSVFAYADKKEKKTAKKTAETENAFVKGTGTVYLFGFSHQLADSVVYFTDVQQIDSIDLDPKTQFLPLRSEISLQLKEYLEGKEHLEKQTACVFFSTKMKKIQKMYAKMRKRYLKASNMHLVMIDSKKFTFKHPFDSFVKEDETE